MRPLGNEADTEEQPKNKRIVPAVYTDTNEDMPLKKALAISGLAHPSFVALLWLIVKIIIIILALMGISLSLFEKPKPKVNDIEFVLVNKEAQPINKHTKFRSDMNSRAGGHHDPRRAVSMPQAPSPKSAAQRKASVSPSKPSPSPAPKASHKAAAKPSPAPRPIITPKQFFKKLMEAPAPKLAKPKATQSPPRPSMQQKHTPPRPGMAGIPRPSLGGIPRPSINRHSSFAVPIPHGTGSSPKYARPSYGSGSGGSGSSRGSALGTSGRRSGPSPMMSPGYGSGRGGHGGGGSRGGRYSSSYSMGGGSIGNPGPGNPHGAPGIDAIREPDFGPYMKELQRRIKRNWDPPRGNESKRVVLMFRISRSGRLLSVRVAHSSGVASADKAAIDAVEMTAPFEALPPEYRGSNIDIQFTFDYNVFGARY